MPRRAAAVCSFIPPHILRSIAERGDDADRTRAQATLDATSEARGARQEVALAAKLPIATAKGERAVFDAQHKRRLPGTVVRRESEKAVDDEAANEAYDAAGATRDFYTSVLKRNSVDDHGLHLDASVHYGVSYANAMWNGRQMVYGDGDGRYFNRFTLALDVIAHELTHGVTQHTAALEYDGEAGALNEHVSDVFGVLTRQFKLKQTARRADWLIGAGLFTKRVHGVAVRSMKAPGTAYDDLILGRDPQPSHMRDFVRTELDNGGVHINSGIPNHAFYLASVALGGKAWELAGKIWYRALTTKLRPQATFADCAAATVAAAAELHGEGSEPVKIVRGAWLDVGVDTPDLPRGQRTTKLVHADFETSVPGAELPDGLLRLR